MQDVNDFKVFLRVFHQVFSRFSFFTLTLGLDKSEEESD